MRHLLLLRCQPGGLTADRKAVIEKLYLKLPEVIAGVNEVQVRYNCVPREQNMDVLVEMDIDGPETLADYLEHPLHLAFVRDSQSFLSAVVSFDCH